MIDFYPHKKDEKIEAFLDAHSIKREFKKYSNDTIVKTVAEALIELQQLDDDEIQRLIKSYFHTGRLSKLGREILEGFLILAYTNNNIRIDKISKKVMVTRRSKWGL